MIEVKSKSCNGTDPAQFLTRKNRPTAAWQPYLLDATFQKYVLEHAHPEFRVSAFLMLADKNTTCQTNGLHQKFRLSIGETSSGSDHPNPTRPQSHPAFTPSTDLLPS